MYTVGTNIAATALALLLALVVRGVYTLLPSIEFQWAVGVLGVASLVFALKELNIIKLWTPQIGWQVPKSWMKHSKVLGQTAYGVVLGAGIFTYIPFASFFVVLAWEAVAGAVYIR